MGKYKFITTFSELDLQDPKVLLNPYYETDDETIAAKLRKKKDVFEVSPKQVEATESESEVSDKVVEIMRKRGRPKHVAGPKTVQTQE